MEVTLRAGLDLNRSPLHTRLGMIARTAMALCFCGSLLVLGQTNSQQKPPAGTTTGGIPGVVAAGIKVELIWMGFQSADGIIGAPDGSLLFADSPPDVADFRKTSNYY